MLRSLKLSILLLGAIGVTACLAVVGQNLWMQNGMHRSAHDAFIAKDLVADILPPPMYLIEMRLVLSQAVEGTLSEAEASTRIDKLTSEYSARAEHWAKSLSGELLHRLQGSQHVEGKRFIAAARNEVMPRIKAGDKEGAREALIGAHRHFLLHLAGVQQTVDSANSAAEVSMAALEANHTASRRSVLLGALAAIALVGVCYRLVLNSVQRPLSACTSFAEGIAAGNLAESLSVMRSDDIGRMQGALCDMQASLRNVVGKVRDTSDSVFTASAEIATGNQDLSVRTEQAASNLQEAASAMEQLSGALKQSADSASQANQLAASAAAVAVRGGVVVSQVVGTMDDISTSSRKIADIIGVIDSIAFQTNILALNAAVEAARAGEQGRGFAVVASEVRSLAQRSAQAAKEIKGLIVASVEKVELGSHLVAAAGETMNEIVASVQRVSDIIGQITAASAEQSEGVGQVNTSVAHLDHMTQQNSALVEQAAAAAASLKEQAGELAQVVGTFRLDQGVRLPAAA